MITWSKAQNIVNKMTLKRTVKSLIKLNTYLFNVFHDLKYKKITTQCSPKASPMTQRK